MFTIQRLSGKIEELIANRLDIDAFEDWFVSESWGYYDVHGDSTSEAIAAVHYVLHGYDSDEIEESRVARELANAIRPFVQETASLEVVFVFRGGHNGGRPRSSAPRCACGVMTINRAKARAHKC